jgi:hypothetical protein
MDCQQTEVTPMTTSSDHLTKSTPRPSGAHWHELTATLSPESKEKFGDWLSQQLAELESELDSFVTPNSLLKSLRR